MHRGASVVVLVGLAVAGLAAGTFVSHREASAGALRATSLSKVTRVTVTATDSRFKLSTRRAPTGMVIFTVINKGKVSHDFKIAGKKTRRLSRGHSATLRVMFSKKGRYPYRSTVRGQAAAGLKGVFLVMAAAAPPPVTTGTVGTAKTTVDVGMFEDPEAKFVLSKLTVPSGMVTFAIKSSCVQFGCSFDLLKVKAGTILFGGQSETWTVGLPPGTYNFHCDVMPFLMSGQLTVTS